MTDACFISVTHFEYKVPYRNSREAPCKFIFSHWVSDRFIFCTYDGCFLGNPAPIMGNFLGILPLPGVENGHFLQNDPIFAHYGWVLRKFCTYDGCFFVSHSGGCSRHGPPIHSKFLSEYPPPGPQHSRRPSGLYLIPKWIQACSRDVVRAVGASEKKHKKTTTIYGCKIF